MIDPIPFERFRPLSALFGSHRVRSVSACGIFPFWAVAGWFTPGLPLIPSHRAGTSSALFYLVAYHWQSVDEIDGTRNQAVRLLFLHLFFDALSESGVDSDASVMIDDAIGTKQWYVHVFLHSFLNALSSLSLFQFPV